jgi:hypothetical protein
MSDYHIMLQTWNKKKLQVVFHIPLPDILNNAGFSYRTALKQSLETSGTITSIYPNTSSDELTKIQNGEVYEVVEYVSFSSTILTPAQKASEIDNYFNNFKNKILELKKLGLEWWGLDRDIT